MCLDVAIAVLFLQWLGGVIDPNTYGLILTMAVVLAVLHVLRVLL